MFEIVLSLHPLASLNNRLSCLSLSRETCWLSSPSSPRRFFFFLRFLFRPRPCLLFAFLRRLCAGPSYSLFFIQALVCLPFYLIIQFFFFFHCRLGIFFFGDAPLFPLESGFVLPRDNLLLNFVSIFSPYTSQDDACFVILADRPRWFLPPILFSPSVVDLTRSADFLFLYSISFCLSPAHSVTQRYKALCRS